MSGMKDTNDQNDTLSIFSYYCIRKDVTQLILFGLVISNLNEDSTLCTTRLKRRRNANRILMRWSGKEGDGNRVRQKAENK
jgi:hypothetical protein